MKYVLTALLLATAVACGGVSESAETAPGPSTTTDVSQSDETTTTAPADTTSTEPEKTTRSDRQRAPDFTLQLGDGGTYTLSEGDKSVYLIFWAEW